MMTLMIKKILILGKKEEQNTNVDEIRDISSNEYNYKRKKKNKFQNETATLSR